MSQKIPKCCVCTDTEGSPGGMRRLGAGLRLCGLARTDIADSMPANGNRLPGDFFTQKQRKTYIFVIPEPL